MRTTKFYRGLVATLALAVVISYAGILIPTFTPKSVAAYENPTKALCVVSKPGGGGNGCTSCPSGMQCAACVNDDPCE